MRDGDEEILLPALAATAAWLLGTLGRRGASLRGSVRGKMNRKQVFFFSEISESKNSGSIPNLTMVKTDSL